MLLKNTGTVEMQGDGKSRVLREHAGGVPNLGQVSRESIQREVESKLRR